MALLSFVDSTPRAYRLKASNAAPPISTFPGAIPNQGHDLGYKTFLNGALVSNILIDTSQVATDTIDYGATDTWGNTASSTRTVIIDAATASTSTTP